VVRVSNNASVNAVNA